MEHPDQAPALTPTCTLRTPQCGHTVWQKTWHIMSRHRNAGASKDTDNSPPAARKLPEESLRPSFHWACRDGTRSIFLVIACYCLVWKPLAPAHKLDRYWTLEISLENTAFDRIWLVLFLLIDAFSRLCSTYIFQSNWSFWICWCLLALLDAFCRFSHPFSLWSHAYSDVFRVPARSSPSSWPKSSSETSVAIPAIIPIAAAASVAVTRPARETSWNKSCTHTYHTYLTAAVCEPRPESFWKSHRFVKVAVKHEHAS